MKKIKIAQIGTHIYTHARQVFIAIRELSDVFEIVGVSEPDKGGCFRLQEEPYKNYPHYEAEEILNIEGLQAVCIETDELTSTYWAQRAMEKGLAVHLEKPGSPDLQSFEKLIRTARGKQGVLQMGYMYRYNPLVQRFLAEAKSGKFGEIISVEAQMSVGQPKEHRQWLSRFQGGKTYYLGCHLVDLILLFQGLPKAIYPFNRCTGAEAVDNVQDYGFVVFDYGKGISFLKTSAAEVNGFARRQLVITGTKATVEIKPFEVVCGNEMQETRAWCTYKEEASPWFDCGRAVEEGRHHRYKPMMEDFAMFIRGEKANPYTLDYELTLMKTLLTCCEIK